MELHVEATSVAHGLALSIPAPQGGGCGLAVGAGEAHTAGSRLQWREVEREGQAVSRGCCRVPCTNPGRLPVIWGLGPTWHLMGDTWFRV